MIKFYLLSNYSSFNLIMQSIAKLKEITMVVQDSVVAMDFKWRNQEVSDNDKSRQKDLLLKEKLDSTV